MGLPQLIGVSATELAIAFRNYCFINPFASDQQQRLGLRLNAQPLPTDIEPVAGPAVPDRPELDRVMPCIRGILHRIKSRIDAGEVSATADDCELVSMLGRGELYFRYRSDLENLASASPRQRSIESIYQRFEADYEFVSDACKRLESCAGVEPKTPRPMDSASHAFAVFFQIRRAFKTISSVIQGRSRPTNALRAAMWESVFSTDFQLYGDLLFDRMHDINTLVLGPSGTGKELVAQTIGNCRYLPYTRSTGFAELPEQAFRPVNLSEFSRDLIESELFGHVAGSFTGATSDREGVFERCEHYHTLFLDEIGELAPFIQVKLLRVLQERSFHRVGDRTSRHFGGKVVAATNRDLESEMNSGRFREDLFFRLCADVVRTPALREQLDDAPDELPELVRGICEQVLGTSNPAILDRLADRVTHQIDESPLLGSGYAWPGNFRELEQCVRSTLIHGTYRPTRLTQPSQSESGPTSMGPADSFAADLRGGRLTLDEVIDRYVRLVHQGSKNLTETARRLGKHRSTIQKRLASTAPLAEAD